MSYFNPQENENKVSNPAELFIEFKSEERFHYYDKEKQEKVSMPDKFYGVILQRFATITGYDDEGNCGIYSNEVRNTTTDELVVKSFKRGVLAKGIYKKDILGKVTAAKFASSVYVALVNGSGANATFKLVNMKFKGAALSAFIDSEAKEGDLVCFERNDELLKKGASKYYKPTITVVGKAPEEHKETLKALDAKVNEYFAQYSTKDHSVVHEVEEAEEVSTKNFQSSANVNSSKAAVVSDAEEMSDLPF